MTEVENLLDAIGFRARDIAHPADLLTMDMATARANVPLSSVDSASGGVDDFRLRALAGAVLQVNVEPQRDSWSALREVIDGRDPEVAAGILLGARTSEVANDPAFALFLSGFERLDNPQLAVALGATTRSLVSKTWPLWSTAMGAVGVECPEEPNPNVVFVGAIAILADSYLRLLGIRDPDTFSALLADVVMQETHNVDAAQHVQIGDLFPSDNPSAVDAGSPTLQHAVNAGAELLVEGAVPFSTRLTVAEVRQRTGLSNAAFYKSFGSLGALERRLLERAGREIADGFREQFFDSMLDELEAGTQSIDSALQAFWARSLDQHHVHVTQGRPGRELTPWLTVPDSHVRIAQAYLTVYTERAEFYDRFVTLTGSAYRPGLSGYHHAAVLHAASLVSDLLIRNAPNRPAAFAILGNAFTSLSSKIIEA